MRSSLLASVDVIHFNSLFINVPNSTAEGQLQGKHKHKNKIKQHRTKQQSKKTQENKNSKSVSLLKLQHDLLKISIDLETAFAADTHLAEGQWLKEQLNVV
jgi:high-affinity K+ transport system ATPase subunit B